ncbi:MAG: hypothetical protein QM820_62660 [Minicystis sp.]
MPLPELLEVVYRFYPRGIVSTSPGYDDTPERRRQVEAARVGAAEYPTWKAMIRRLRARYEVNDLSLHILSGSVDPAYTAKLVVPGKEAEALDLDRRLGVFMRFGFRVSLLGPYYLIHRTDDPDEEPCARDVAREIEATYRGYEPVPPELGNVVVPDVALDTVGPGEVTVYDCLLLSHW